MALKRTNFAGSIFYYRNSWQELNNMALKPFIYDVAVNGLIIHYNIFLKNNQGDHITIQLDTMAEEKLQQQFLNDIGGFIKQNPSMTKPVKYPVNSLFMPYENNTIAFNIDEIPPSGNEDIIKLRAIISQQIMDILLADKVDNESILTFITYLQLGCIKAAYPEIQTSTHNILQLLEDVCSLLPATHSKLQYLQLDELLEGNETIFNSIIEDIWQEPPYFSEMEWLNVWIKTCESYLQEKTILAESFILISKLIYEHLGLAYENLLYLFTELTYKTFSAFNLLNK